MRGHYLLGWGARRRGRFAQKDSDTGLVLESI